MLKRVAVIGCLTLIFVGPAFSSAGGIQFPDDLQKLWPDKPAFIVAASSVNELDRQWRAIAEMMDEGDDEAADLIGMIGEEVPQIAQILDLERPLAMAAGLPDFMTGGDPPLTFIVPLSGELSDEVRMELDEEGLIQIRQGDYLAFSMDPAYTPAATLPDLARDLSPGFITSRVDLEMVIAAYRPLAEMSLGAMAAAPLPPDTTATGEPAPPTGMNQEEIAALQNMTRDIMDSIRRGDLSLAVEGETLTLHTGFSVFPDSPLDPGPQPSFEEALQLTRLLPRGENITQTMALDQTRQFEVFKDYYRSSMARTAALLPAEQGAAYLAWMEAYLESVDLFSNPLAASVHLSDLSVSAHVVMKCEDASGDMERLAGLFEGLSDVDLGIKLKRLPAAKVSGTEVRNWTIAYDTEKLTEMSPDPVPPGMGAANPMEAQQMIAFLSKVTPNLSLAVKGNHLFLSADDNPAGLAHMIQEAGQRRGAADPAVAAVAATAGPAVQQVVTGDLMAIIAWATEMMEELEEDEYEAIQGNPIPFTSSLVIDGPAYRGAWTMDMPAVRSLVDALKELDEMESEDEYEDEATEVDD